MIDYLIIAGLVVLYIACNIAIVGFMHTSKFGRDD